MTRVGRALLAIVGVTLLNVPLDAQSHSAIGLFGAASRLNESTIAANNTFTGFVFGLEGTIVAGKFGVDFRYLEGNLSPDSAECMDKLGLSLAHLESKCKNFYDSAEVERVFAVADGAHSITGKLDPGFVAVARLALRTGCGFGRR